jgi:hypothetical protein
MARSWGLELCCRKGISSLVLERAETLRATGAGIGIQVNGWRALDQLEVGDELRKLAMPLSGYVRACLLLPLSIVLNSNKFSLYGWWGQALVLSLHIAMCLGATFVLWFSFFFWRNRRGVPLLEIYRIIRKITVQKYKEKDKRTENKLKKLDNKTREQLIWTTLAV